MLSLLLTAAALIPGSASAQPASIAPGHVAVTKPITSPLPAGFEQEPLHGLWLEGLALERSHQFLQAAQHYQKIAEMTAGIAYPYWKTARSYWRHAESLPGDAKAERLPFFELSDRWASQGLAIDPECAECMLWKFGALGRIGTTRGILKSLQFAPTMRDLIDDGIALNPRYADSPYNSTLGNLYYAGAVFYRVVPDSILLQWIVGVRGDLDRSLEMIRRAVGGAPGRVDYQVELGAILFCYAKKKDARWAEAEARKVLTRVQDLPHYLSTDPLDVEHADILVHQPDKACGYSRDGWIDSDRLANKASLTGS